MKQPIRISIFALAVVLFATACGKKSSAVGEQRSAFSADSAYQYIAQQMSFGPRVPNGKAHTDCAVYLMQFLRACDADVELQKGTMPDYSGRQQTVYNIIGHFYTEQNKHHPRLLLCAHYDTRPWADEEENYEDRYMNVPGANDGASGVGVLLEVARQISLLMADSALTTPVDIVFFDCEDMGTPAFFTGVEREDTWCLGSQLWGIRRQENANAPVYRFGILLDMVGAPDAVFPRELYSQQFANNYVEEVWRTADKLGYGKYFINQTAYPLIDDHYYVNTLGGVPCIDIIHYDARSATGFPAWWHTREDDMRNISHETLQAVGEVVMAMVQK